MPDTLMTSDAQRAEAPPTRSRDLNELAAALAKAQGEIEGAIKDKSNPAFRSKYADLGAVWDAIREPFSKNGLSVVQFPRRDGNSVEVETILLHSSGQWMSGTFSVPTAKQDAHGFGSATTYARRFSLSAVCGVAPVDDDGNAAAGKANTHIPTSTHPGDFAEEARRDGLTTETRSTYQVAKDKKGEDAAKKWTDTAIQTLNFAQSTADLDGWTADPKNAAYLERLEESYPAQHQRVAEALDNARLALRGRAA
jgi:hypothetical protein